MQQQFARKSTDPPVASHGKMGQDLFLAIDHRDLAGVQSLLDKGADPNSKNGLEFSPLYVSAASHQLDAMKVLLDAGAKVDDESSYGTALTFAAATGNFEGAKLLISRGANVNTARTDGITVLMMASNSGSIDLVNELIKRNANVVQQNANGSTALIYAARNGHVAVGQSLLEAGSASNRANIDGETSLMAAAVVGSTGFVKLLLENGADPNLKNTKGQTALILAAKYGDYPEVVRALLKGGADAKLKDSLGSSAAVYANRRGHSATAALLGASKSTPAPARSARQAVATGIKLIESSMNTFNKRTGCISCHQEGLGRMATGMARDRGYSLDQATQAALEGRINGAVNFMKPMHEQALQNPEAMKQLPLIEINEVSTGDAWLLAGMAANHQKPDAANSAMAMVLARQQSPGGFWSFSLPRIPMQSSFFTFTALAIRSLNTYGPKSGATEIAGRIAKAKSWLLKAAPKNSEDRASQLLGLKWASASAKELKKPVEAIKADQRPDGGWAQVPGLQSDAYATGQALYALHSAGAVPVTSSVYKRGVQYLLRHQDEDGSWFVNKRALPANNYFDAGFPHGESQYASFNGTCWATMALMETFSKSK